MLTDNEKLLARDQVFAYIQDKVGQPIPAHPVRLALRHEEIPIAVLIGTRRFYRKADIDAWLEAQVTEPKVHA